MTWPSDSLCQMLSVGCMWRQKFLLPRIWRLVLKRNPWTTRLFGPTYDPSTACRGVDSYLGSLRVSLAQTIPSQENERGSSASMETSGAISFDAFANWSQLGYFSKTSPASLFHIESNAGDGIVTDRNGRSILFLPDSDSFLETWPRSGSMRSGRVYRRPKLALHTSARESSSWPTARAEDSESCGNHPNATDSLGGGNLMSTPKHTGGIDLEGAAKLWQTPSVADVTGGHMTRSGVRSGEMLLKGQASQFPTPAARDYRSETGGAATMNHFNRPAGPSLPAMIEHSFLPAQQTETHGDPSSQSDSTSPQPSAPKRLNPKFVEWLMGMPEGWVSAGKINSEALETWSCLNRALLRSLFSSIER